MAIEEIRAMLPKPRDLIIDNFNREGIVVETCEPPPPTWFANQTLPRLAAARQKPKRTAVRRL